MSTTSRERIETFFQRIARGEIESALEYATEDVVIDRSRSKALWRGVSRGRTEAREAYEEFRAAWEELGGVDWALLDVVRAGSRRFAVETGLRGRGPATGLQLDATAGWSVELRDGRIAEAVMHQSVAEALRHSRRLAFAAARLYFVCEGLPGGRSPAALLEAAIRGGVDVIQLREKSPRCAEEVLALAQPFRRAADEHGALFILNDTPELVAPAGADGVHVGQDDVDVAEARAEAGSAAVVGLSTHSAAQLDAARAATGPDRPDQISVGPVWETPTKEGRPATGLELIAHAARGPDEPPWFAIGGIDRETVVRVAEAGARRAVVVRAIRDADEPEAAARALRAALAGDRAH